ncbi:MAG: hypothetical protein AAGI30_10555 [Planctomycetota bacterium]
MTRTNLVMLSVAGTATMLGVGLLVTAANAQPGRGGPGGPPAFVGEGDDAGPRGVRERGPRGDRRGGPPPEAMLLRADQDNSGTLDDDELAMIAERYAAWHDTFFKPLLEEFDEDGDGALTGDERRNARQAVGERQRERAERRRDRVVEEFDADGSGDLSEEERETARETMRARAQEKRAEVIEMFDEDGDGQLTGAEREAAGEYIREQRRARFLDIDADGDLDADDVTALVALIENGDRRADLNRDGAVDELDLQVLTDEIASN